MKMERFECLCRMCMDHDIRTVRQSPAKVERREEKNIENENQLQHLISYLPFYVDYSVEQQSNKRAIDFGAKF